jgi:uncharacterized membrane protein YfhO
VTRLEPDRVALAATLERPGVVVLADVFYPGWSLAVDGASARLLRVNVMMRGVAVPAGEHTLEFRYRPASFHVGLAVSGAGLTALAALGVTFARRRHRVEGLSQTS